jgi:hypothetical protein
MHLNRGDKLEVLLAQVDAVDEWRAVARIFSMTPRRSRNVSAWASKMCVERVSLGKLACSPRARPRRPGVRAAPPAATPSSAHPRRSHRILGSCVLRSLRWLRGLASLQPRLTGRGPQYIGQIAYSSRRERRNRRRCCRARWSARALVAPLALRARRAMRRRAWRTHGRGEPGRCGAR